MKKIIIIALLFVLSGCTYYAKPGMTKEQEARDEAECHYEGTKATANSGNGAQLADVEVQCMQLRGYQIYAK